jgi:hypothetical protein
VNQSLTLVTALCPVIGYHEASAIAHEAQDEGTTLREAALKNGYICAGTTRSSCPRRWWATLAGTWSSPEAPLRSRPAA